MDARELTGSIVALVTPFASDGSIDFGALSTWWTSICRTIRMDC